MVDMNKVKLGAGAVLLLVLGAAGGAAVVETTRPSVEMAPASPVAISSLAQRDGIVTIKGKVAEVYGDRFILADGSGRTMVDTGHDSTAATTGAALTVQGRYDDGQFHASFLVDQAGNVMSVGPRHGFRHGKHGFERHDRDRREGPDRFDQQGGPDAPPPPVTPVTTQPTATK
ncbi:MAG TPA: hypothetical protein VK980_07335 [Sphingomonas sp.]|nr:hypothetical protein [Sphingomonas sp.]